MVFFKILLQTILLTDDLTSFGCRVSSVSKEDLGLFCRNNNCTPSETDYDYDSKGRIIRIQSHGTNQNGYPIDNVLIFVYRDLELIRVYRSNVFAITTFKYEAGVINAVYSSDGWINSSWNYKFDGSARIIGRDYHSTWKGSLPQDCSTSSEFTGNNYSKITTGCISQSTYPDTAITSTNIPKYDNKRNVGQSMFDAFSNQPVLESFYLGIHSGLLNLSENNPVETGSAIYSYSYNSQDYPVTISRIANGDTTFRTQIKYVNCN